MTDFEPPSFSLGLDCDLFDSEPQITQNPDDEAFETLVADDSEPEYPDSHKRLRRRFINATSSPAELHSTAVIDDEDINVFSSQEDMRAGSDFMQQLFMFYTFMHI